MKNKNRNYDRYIIFFILLVIIIFAFNGIYNNTVNKNKLKNFNITQGIITEFSYDNYGYFLGYKYSVDSIEYHGNVDATYFKCEDGVPGCLGKTFEVKYSVEDPSISEIDLGEYNKYKSYYPTF